jgi:outer membrane cobalamin receptor
LHGLTDDEIRVFVDGLPIALSDFGFGIASVPLNWLERVEVYRGLVPLGLGADVLRGAIHLITELELAQPMLELAYAAGAFDTHQLAFRLRS